MRRPGLTLIVTHGNDDHVPLVAAELEARGAELARFDTERYPDEVAVDLTVRDGDASVVLRLDGDEIPGERIGAVLYRHLRLPTAPGIGDAEARRLAESELRAALEGGLFALDCLWINHPHANRLSRNKPLQLALAVRHGFAVPETAITRDPDRIRTLYREWNGEMVAKLVGGQLVGTTADDQYVIHTTLIDKTDLGDDAALAASPAIYQRRVAKAHELRATVVGERVFGCRIDSQASDDEAARVDWRRAGPQALEHSAIELEPEVEERCLALARSLGLEFGGIDLIVTPDGDTVFLEINAAGQWAWIERMTGQPIAAAIAERLIVGTSNAGGGSP